MAPLMQPGMPQLPPKRQIVEINRPEGLSEAFGTRPVERIQLSRDINEPAVQKHIKYLHDLGYRLVQVLNEKMSKDYIAMDDPGQSSEFLSGPNNGMQFPTLYFQASQAVHIEYHINTADGSEKTAA